MSPKEHEDFVNTLKQLGHEQSENYKNLAMSQYYRENWLIADDRCRKLERQVAELTAALEAKTRELIKKDVSFVPDEIYEGGICK